MEEGLEDHTYIEEMKRELPDSLQKEFIGFGEDVKKEMKQEYVEQEIKEDLRKNTVTEMKKEGTSGKMKRKLLDEDVEEDMKEEYIAEMRELPDSLHKKCIGFGEDVKQEMKQEYIKQEIKEDLRTNIVTEIKEKCTLGKSKSKLLHEDVKEEIKEEYIENEIKDNRKMDKKKECHSHQQIDENTLETGKKWGLVPLGSLFILKCPECHFEELIKNTNNMNLFSFHMKTHEVLRYPPTAQGYTCSYPCSICSINLKVGELMDHMGFHGHFGIHSDFWNFQLRKKDWYVMCPVCPLSQKAKQGTIVKICNFPKHVMKVHGSLVFEKMNSEEGALGCQVCGESKVILTNVEMHERCRESRNNKPTQNNIKRTSDQLRSFQFRDEEVIKMRILVDGDGTGDERRLNLLLKTFIKWCNTDDDVSSSEQTYQSMLTQLSNIELNMTKSRLAADMNEAELRNYEVIHEKVKEGIVSGMVDVDKTKKDLVEAKRIRKNRMEYDALAKVIKTHPDRKTSGARLETVQVELASLKEREQGLKDKLDTGVF